MAAQLTADNVDDAWNDAGSNTLGAWDFGTDSQLPALNYADYDGGGTAFACDQFPVDACGPPGILLPGQEGVSVDEPPVAPPGGIVTLAALEQRLTIESWNWQQLAGVMVSLRGADTATPDLYPAEHQGPPGVQADRQGQRRPRF